MSPSKFDGGSVVSTSSPDAVVHGDGSAPIDGSHVSPSGTSIPPATQIVDSASNLWTVSGGVVLENGADAGYSADVQLLLYYKGKIYQENGTGEFFAWSGSTWLEESADPRTSTAPPPNGSFGVKANGGQLVSTLDGSPVELIGANLSGLENSTNWAPFANAPLSFWQSLKDYQGSNINVVRLQLNSAYWLGYACGQSTATYQSTVQNVVQRANQAGLYVILALFWDMPNINGAGFCPVGQSPMPSADHAPAFWKSVADIYGKNPAVIFELFNEPFGANTGVEWDNNGAPGPSVPVLANGGSFSPLVYQDNNGGNSTMITNNITYQVAGEIPLMQAIRAEGGTNFVLASPGYWASTIQQWLATYNTKGNPDSLKNFGAAWHDYGGTTGTAPPLAVVAAGYPIVMTETYGFDQNFTGVVDNLGGSWTSGGKGLSEPAGYAFARAQHIGYLCGWQVNDWDPTQTELSLTATPPWSGCASQ